MLGKQLQTAAAGSGAAEGLGIEDVFSTYLYTGNGGTQTITNGIDLAGEGGMVFLGHRNGTSIGNLDRAIHDSERGAQYAMYPSTTNGSAQNTNSLSSFNSDGFSLATGNARYNDNGYDFASWTFRKAPGFFDVVTYAGDGTSNRQISHNLGSTPGMIIVKKLDSNIANFGWYVWHRSLSSNQEMLLNSTAAASSNSFFTAVTSTYFTPASTVALNGSGSNYVAYFFAHDEAIFGENEDQSVIKCGSYTHGSGVTEVNVGFEPQWLLIKRTDSAQSWYLFDNMRGWTADANRDAKYVSPNNSVAEAGIGLGVFANGFRQDASVWGSGGNYIYIAIRRGPMKTPTDATEVFATDVGNGSASGPAFDSNFPVDLGWYTRPANADGMRWEPRLTGGKYMTSSSTAAELGPDSWAGFDDNLGWGLNFGSNYRSWMFRRAPGFFDVVAYTGDGVAGRAVPHNLGVEPELMIQKERSDPSNWPVYCKYLTGSADSRLLLNLANAESTNPLASEWNVTEPTASVFYLAGSGYGVNQSGITNIMYLFASCPGVSKVGSYTGTGSTLNIDCGFSAGARFVLIKRSDSTGDWYVWDTARGIVSGNDPYLLLNTTDAEVTTTDYIDPYSAGFTVTSTAPAALNASGGTYIFLAIA